MSSCSNLNSFDPGSNLRPFASRGPRVHRRSPPYFKVFGNLIAWSLSKTGMGTAMMIQWQNACRGDRKQPEAILFNPEISKLNDSPDKLLSAARGKAFAVLADFQVGRGLCQYSQGVKAGWAALAPTRPGQMHYWESLVPKHYVTHALRWCWGGGRASDTYREIWRFNFLSFVEPPNRSWAEWVVGHKLEIPTDSYNTGYRANAPYLVDRRATEGAFYLFSAEHEKHTSGEYEKRGWNKLGLYRFEDLVHWLHGLD